MDNSRKFPLFLNNFWIKIIAIVTMTFDHIGVMIQGQPAYEAFRIIGRISLPLFCFLIAEGALHTKSFGKYALRLGIMASAISIAVIVCEVSPSLPSLRNGRNIFIDLLLGATAIYCLKQKQWYIKALAALPLMFGIASFIATALESCGCHGHILWFPFFLRTQYGWYSITMIIGFFFATILAKFFISYLSGLTGISEENYKDSDIERHAINIISVLIFAAISALLFFIGKSMPLNYVYWRLDIQLYALIAGAFILLYNGRRGYNKKWFQYGSYLYYPVHMLIIYSIFALI